MDAEICLLTVELDGCDGLIVTFSDGTTAGYVVEELLALRPLREKTKKEKGHQQKADGATVRDNHARIGDSCIGVQSSYTITAARFDLIYCSLDLRTDTSRS